MDNRLKLCQIFVIAKSATYYNRFDIRRGGFAESLEFRVESGELRFGVSTARTRFYSIAM